MLITNFMIHTYYSLKILYLFVKFNSPIVKILIPIKYIFILSLIQ
nr:MAG TPA: hypothetical protein [Caudoviricetes sp.]